VDLLLSKQSELAHTHNQERLSPLHVTAHYGSTDAIKALLRHCPDMAGDGGQQQILEVHLLGTVAGFAFFQAIFFWILWRVILEDDCTCYCYR
jgi:hypothetical protein